MWWGIGIGGVILYVLLLFFLGIRTLRNGHGWLFFFGIFFPLLWLIGRSCSPAHKGPNGRGMPQAARLNVVERRMRRFLSEPSAGEASISASTGSRRRSAVMRPRFG